MLRFNISLLPGLDGGEDGVEVYEGQGSHRLGAEMEILDVG